MKHFTQLGVSGNQDQKPQGKALPSQSPEGQRSQTNPNKADGRQKIAALIGALIVTALLGVFVLESACSKESGKTATIATPNQIAVSQSPGQMLTSSASTSPSVIASQPAKRKSRQRKLSASVYTNSAYGVSFRYPNSGSLKEGDEANLELHGLGQVEMNFVQPGGTIISAVELPHRPYAGTNFNTAFFNVSVNPKLTAEECEQFAFPGTSELETAPVSRGTKIGSAEFRAVEAFASEENNEADVKYYHIFQNGGCYEFALGLETVSEVSALDHGVKRTLKPVDHNEIFRQLNWILSTVKIQPVAPPVQAVPVVAKGLVPADPVTTEAH